MMKVRRKNNSRVKNRLKGREARAKSDKERKMMPQGRPSQASCRLRPLCSDLLHPLRTNLAAASCAATVAPARAGTGCITQRAAAPSPAPVPAAVTIGQSRQRSNRHPARQRPACCCKPSAPPVRQAGKPLASRESIPKHYYYSKNCCNNKKKRQNGGADHPNQPIGDAGLQRHRSRSAKVNLLAVPTGNRASFADRPAGPIPQDRPRPAAGRR